MSCPQCIVALAGFGEDPSTDPSAASAALTQAGSDIGTGVTALFVSPLIGSVVATVAGAVLWKEHRVLGGLAGLLLGGAAGAAVGAMIAKDKFDDVLDSVPRTGWEVAQGGSSGPGVEMSTGPLTIGRLSIPKLPQVGTSTATETSDGRQTIVPRLGSGLTSTSASSCPQGQTMSNGRCVTLRTMPGKLPGAAPASLSSIVAKLGSMLKLSAPLKTGSSPAIRVVRNTPVPASPQIRVVPNTPKPAPVSSPTIRVMSNTAFMAQQAAAQTPQPSVSKVTSLMGTMPSFTESPAAREAWRRPCPAGFKLFGDGKCHLWKPL